MNLKINYSLTIASMFIMCLDHVHLQLLLFSPLPPTRHHSPTFMSSLHGVQLLLPTQAWTTASSHTLKKSDPLPQGQPLAHSSSVRQDPHESLPSGGTWDGLTSAGCAGNHCGHEFMSVLWPCHTQTSI